MIEKFKYDSLLKYKCKSCYVNSTPSGIYSFDMAKIKPEWTSEIAMPKATDFHIFRKEIEKEYALLKISEAKKLL